MDIGSVQVSSNGWVAAFQFVSVLDQSTDNVHGMIRGHGITTKDNGTRTCAIVVVVYGGSIVVQDIQNRFERSCLSW